VYEAASARSHTPYRYSHPPLQQYYTTIQSYEPRGLVAAATTALAPVHRSLARCSSLALSRLAPPATSSAPSLALLANEPLGTPALHVAA